MTERVVIFAGSKRVEWVVLIFGSDEQTFDREADARTEYERARRCGSLCALRKRTITEEEA